MGIFTAWICTQSFAVKLLNTGGMNLGSWLIGLVYICFIISNQVYPPPRWSSPERVTVIKIVPWCPSPLKKSERGLIVLMILCRS
jgi:hypothetical protein